MALRVSMSASFKCARMKYLARKIPVREPMGLKAWAKFRRRTLVSWDPMERTKGLQVVSKMERPPANTKIAIR